MPLPRSTKVPGQGLQRPQNRVRVRDQVLRLSLTALLQTMRPKTFQTQRRSLLNKRHLHDHDRHNLKFDHHPCRLEPRWPPGLIDLIRRYSLSKATRTGNGIPWIVKTKRRWTTLESSGMQRANRYFYVVSLQSPGKKWLTSTPESVVLAN